MKIGALMGAVVLVPLLKGYRYFFLAVSLSEGEVFSDWYHWWEGKVASHATHIVML